MGWPSDFTKDCQPLYLKTILKQLSGDKLILPDIPKRRAEAPLQKPPVFEEDEKSPVKVRKDEHLHEQDEKSPVRVKKDEHLHSSSLSSEKYLMTRRFTIAEKLRIIDKFKSTKNVSETCR